VTTLQRLTAALTGAVATTLLAAPLVVVAPAHAQLPPEDRPSVAPNVMFPVIAAHAKDLKTSGRRPGTEIKAKCGKAVRAATPGTAVVTSSKHSGPALVRIVTSKGRLTTWYGFMPSAAVTTGQIIQAGQRIGVVGHTGDARMCSLYFAVTTNGGEKTFNPSRWLNYHVGKPFGAADLFNNRGIVVASLNTLGASHTRDSSRYATYDVRTPKQVALLRDTYHVDVVGLQEFQSPQRTAFLAAAGSTYGIYPDDETLATTSGYGLTENSIIWNNSTMEFISGELIDVPYFTGYRKMPVVQLLDRATGRTAYFINVHNPASGVGYGDQTEHRRQAIAIERAKIIALRATGRPVFLTGDFNDRLAAFCPLTAGMLTITPDSIPSMTCAPPPTLGIDWVFTAGGARFTRYARDWKPKDLNLTDHPIVWTRAHLSE
jgi:endonuclease/exonuclease/phosphatase family metal-dependent hydrolase